MKPCAPGVTIRQFALATVAERLRKAVKAIDHAAESPDEEAVHQMRVSIRRLQQAIRLFRQYLRKRGVKQVRAELKQLMEPAGELRNHDIALQIMRRAGCPLNGMKERRVIARQALTTALASTAGGHPEERWPTLLGVEAREEKAVEV